jgi:tetratricopeptide (TPR) repeat protein
MKKLMMVVSVLLPLNFFLNPALALYAETKEIVAEGTYIMGDGETPIIAEGRAVEQAKRYAVEQAGTYVKSYSRVKNFEIAEDEIEVLASGMLEIIILDKKRTVEAEAVKFWVKLRATVKPDKIDVIVERIRENGISQEYEQIKDAFDKSQAELAKLKEQLAATKAEPERKEIIGKIGDQEKGFRARQLHSDALRAFSAGRMDEALELLSRAVADDPAFYPAYSKRGWVYYKQAEYDKAIPDFGKAIELMPKGAYGASAYAGRGMSLSRKNRFETAIADLTQALRLNPNPPPELEVGIHAHLGKCLLAEGERQQAKNHYQRACDLGDKGSCKALQLPRLKNLKGGSDRKDIIGTMSIQGKGSRLRQLHADALRDFSAGRMDEALERLSRAVAEDPAFYQAYSLRGFVYYKQAEYDKAIPDFDKVIKLMPTGGYGASAYAGRGMSLSRKNRFEAAIADLTQALRLDPNPKPDLGVGIRLHLGKCLLAVGERQQAKDHYRIACELGEKGSCKALESPRLKNLK